MLDFQTNNRELEVSLQTKETDDLGQIRAHSLPLDHQYWRPLKDVDLFPDRTLVMA